MKLPPLFPIMQAAHAHGVRLEHAYLIFEAAKVGMGVGTPQAPAYWRTWASDEAAAEDLSAAQSFYWWACAHVEQQAGR
jgi:hypothetical protein